MALDELAAHAVRELEEAGQRARFTSRAPGAAGHLPRETRWARRRTALAYMAAGFAVAVAIGGVTWIMVGGGEPAPPVAPDTSLPAVDRWGLAGVDLPDTVEEIGIVFEAMPPEVAGLPGGGSGGEHLVSYGNGGTVGSSLAAQGPDQRIGFDGSPRSPADALAAMAEAPELVILGSLLEGEAVWLHGAHTGEDGTEYFLVWGEAAGDWLFYFDGWSMDDLDALVLAFIATVEAAPAAPTAAPGPAPAAPSTTGAAPTTRPPPEPTTTSAPATSTTTTLSPGPPGIERLEAGLFCRDLNALGYGYADAVAYWDGEGRPGRMDADRNGIPCETVYTAAEVVAYWGEPPPAAATNEFAFVRTVEAGPPGTIVVDYAQWFVDDDADRAAVEDGVIEPGASLDNPWYVRNVNPRLRSFRLSADVVVILGDWHPYAWEPGYECVGATPATIAAVGLEDHPTWGCVTDLAELATVVADQHAVDPAWHVMVWLVVEGETVTAIQEQYTP